MNQIVTIYELYEVDGVRGEPHVGICGYFQTLEEAQQAGYSLHHANYGIQPVFAMETEGKTYLLKKEQPVSFGLKER
jgi:hypothetical protein